MRSVGLYAALALLVLGCARSSPAGAGEAGPSVSPGRAHSVDPPAKSAKAAEPPANPSGDGTWVEAVRMERWADAARLIDALDKKKRDEPEVRYARARAAIALGDHQRAVKLLDGLGKKLPLLAGDIALRRARAELEAGPYLDAAHYFEKQGDAGAWINAARAFHRAGKSAQARAQVDRAIHRLLHHGSTRLRARAHALRAELAEKAGEKKLAVADLRWLATAAPAAPESKGVEARIQKLDPKRVLAPRQRYDRAMALARAGKADLALSELDRIKKGVPERELLHARGWALYMARKDYAKASEYLAQSAKLGGRDSVKDQFYAARALSRADQDEKAIAKYKALAARYPRSGYAEEALYLAARLEYILGHWKKADAAYQHYLGRFGKKGRFVDSARYEQSVTWLASGKHKPAARRFAVLAKATDEPRLEARYHELEGVALAGLGNKDAAAERFRHVIDERPLSFSALAAAARLKELGQKLPPLIEPAKSGKPHTPPAFRLPPRVKLLRRIGLDRDAARALAAYEPIVKKQLGDSADEALCHAYGSFSTAARRYKVGQRAAHWSHLDNAPTNGTRWVWNCIYPRPYEPLVRAAEKKNGLPRDLVYAVMRQESGFRPAVVSAARAVGLLQLIPPTARTVAGEVGVDYDPLLLRSPPYNIRLGAFYLHKVLGTFGGSVALAAAAYNAGPARVSHWLESGEHLPLDVWVARIPFHETRNYVGRVVGNMARYAYLDGGESAVPALELALPKGLRAGPDAY